MARPMRLARKLSHQNLIRVYEGGEDQERPFYTMQFLEGLSLRKIIDLRMGKGEFFKISEIEPILGQIANAMDAAHKLGPHGNLKPENVLVLPDLLKVGDFGLSLGIPRLPFVQAVRQRKADAYLAPEYVQGGEVDQRADIYALWVIVGEMLSGLTPDDSVPELIQRNPEVPPALEGLYRRATNSNPLARPKTASEFFDEFADIARRVSPPPLRSRPEIAAVPAVPRPRSPGTAPTVELRKRSIEKAVPPRLKQNGLAGKYVLKQAMRGLVPDEVLNRAKSGFGAPVRAWIHGPLRDMVRDRLTSTAFRTRGWFDAVRVQRLLEDTWAGRVDGAYVVWALVMIDHWAERFLASPLAASEPALAAGTSR